MSYYQVIMTNNRLGGTLGDRGLDFIIRIHVEY